MTQLDLQKQSANAAAEGVLIARPRRLESAATIKAGLDSVAVEAGREALLYVPATYRNTIPATFALLLHGAGGNASHGIGLLQDYADKHNIVLLAPKSFYPTWDVIADEYGADIEFINLALQFVFESCRINTARCAVGGFSDGASYALSLGLINGDLFSHIVAFSPGFMAVTRQIGAPEIFISHGTKDSVLPIDRCSRRLVLQLKKAGYAVNYQEFNGGHSIPQETAESAVEFLLA